MVLCFQWIQLHEDCQYVNFPLIDLLRPGCSRLISHFCLLHWPPSASIPTCKHNTKHLTMTSFEHVIINCTFYSIGVLPPLSLCGVCVCVCVSPCLLNSVILRYRHYLDGCSSETWWREVRWSTGFKTKGSHTQRWLAGYELWLLFTMGAVVWRVWKKDTTCAESQAEKKKRVKPQNINTHPHWDHNQQQTWKQHPKHTLRWDSMDKWRPSGCLVFTFFFLN